MGGFATGTRKVYDFLDDNPECALLDIAFVNNPNVIRKIDNFVAINSCLEIDLTGQVCRPFGCRYETVVYVCTCVGLQ